MMTEDQQKLLQKLYAQQKATESGIEIIQERMELVQASLNSHRRGLGVLQGFEGKKKGEKMLINVGGNIFIDVQLANPDRVARDIGSGVRIVQNLEDAKKSVEETTASLEQHYAQLAQQHEVISNQAADVGRRLGDLVKQMQG